jgi:hypothetical protein
MEMTSTTESRIFVSPSETAAFAADAWPLRADVFAADPNSRGETTSNDTESAQDETYVSESYPASEYDHDYPEEPYVGESYWGEGRADEMSLGETDLLVEAEPESAGEGGVDAFGDPRAAGLMGESGWGGAEFAEEWDPGGGVSQQWLPGEETTDSEVGTAEVGYAQADYEAGGEVGVEPEAAEVELAEGVPGVGEAFPSGLMLNVTSGLDGPGEQYWDPHSTGLPLYDTGAPVRSKKLTTNFTVGELVRSGGRSDDRARISVALVQCLQAIRDRVGRPVAVTSGFRSWQRNVEVYRRAGKKPTLSRHCSGQAADIKIAGMTGMQIAKLGIDVCGARIGVGIGADFAHIDVRGHFEVWTYFTGARDRATKAEIVDYCRHRSTPPSQHVPQPHPTATPTSTVRAGRPAVDRLPVLQAHAGSHPDLVQGDTETWEEATRRADSTPVLQSSRFAGDTTLASVLAGRLRLGGKGTPPIPAPVLSTGPAVAKVQQALIDLGYRLPVFGADGTFGSETGTAVSKFKTSRNIQPTDPVVGRATITALDTELLARERHGPTRYRDRPRRVAQRRQLPSRLRASTRGPEVARQAAEQVGRGRFIESGGAFWLINGLNPTDLLDALRECGPGVRQQLLAHVNDTAGRYDSPRLTAALRAASWEEHRAGIAGIGLLDTIRAAQAGPPPTSFARVWAQLAGRSRPHVIEILRVLPREVLTTLRDRLSDAPSGADQRRFTEVITDLLGAGTDMSASDVIDLEPLHDLDKKMAKIYDLRGQMLHEQAAALGINTAAAAGIMQVESGGETFSPATSLSIVRFENHVFWGRWGRTHPHQFDQHFDFLRPPGEDHTQGHLFRARPTDAWSTFHGNHTRERAVLNFAISLAGDTAYECASFGAGQTMGFNHTMVGFPTARAMAEQYDRSERAQITGIFQYIRGAGLAAAINRRDFAAVARGYNGPAKVAEYSPAMQAAADTYARVTAGKRHVIP